MSPDEFREDVHRSIDVLHKSSESGRSAIASASIARSTPGGAILSELGFKYSSSFPISHPRYGFPTRRDEFIAGRNAGSSRSTGGDGLRAATGRWRRWVFPIDAGVMASGGVGFRARGPAVLYLHPTNSCRRRGGPCDNGCTRAMRIAHLAGTVSITNGESITPAPGAISLHTHVRPSRACMLGAYCQVCIVRRWPRG